MYTDVVHVVRETMSEGSICMKDKVSTAPSLSYTVSMQGSYWQNAAGAAAEISAEKVKNNLK